MDMRMSTPKKNRSPGTQMMDDVTMSMDGAHLSTPVKNKDLLGIQKRK